MAGEPAKKSKSNRDDAPPKRSASSASRPKHSSSSSRQRSKSDAERHDKSSSSKNGGDLKRSQSSRSHGQPKSKATKSKSPKPKPQDGGSKSKSSSNKKSTNKDSQKKSAPSSKKKSKPVENYGTKVVATNGSANKAAAAAMNEKKKVQKFNKDAQKAIPAQVRLRQNNDFFRFIKNVRNVSHFVFQKLVEFSFTSFCSAETTFQVRMISGSHDAQTSADVSNINSQFQLPDPAGKSGGACTASLLEVLYDIHDKGLDGKVSWVDVLRDMRDVLEDKGYEQIPQLTSSRMIDVSHPFAITPTNFDSSKNKKRAVLIGINYSGQSGELSGCVSIFLASLRPVHCSRTFFYS